MSSFRRTLTVRRRADGNYNQDDNAGFFEVEGEETTFTIEASVQPLSGSDIRLLPENRREEELTKIYTDSELRASEKGSAGNCDIVVIKGRDYEVVTEFPWENNVINHFKYILSRRTTNDVVPPEAVEEEV